MRLHIRANATRVVKMLNVFKIAIVLLSFSLSAKSLASEGEAKLADSKWMQFNLMRSIDNKIPFGYQQDTYLEMEFGGRSGVLDLYGYLDIFDIFDSSDSDRHNSDNFFVKLAPRISLQTLTGQPLGNGVLRELFVASLFKIGDRELFEQYVGLGSDLEIPVWGGLSLNLMARYVRENYGAANERKWDGYILSTNWFRPFYFLANKSFIAYQGYFDYQFGATAIADGVNRSETSLEWFNGFYWHSDRYALGYGFKIYQDMALLKDGGFAGQTNGLGHYFSATYKF